MFYGDKISCLLHLLNWTDIVAFRDLLHQKNELERYSENTARTCQNKVPMILSAFPQVFPNADKCDRLEPEGFNLIRN